MRLLRAQTERQSSAGPWTRRRCETDSDPSAIERNDETPASEREFTNEPEQREPLWNDAEGGSRRAAKGSEPSRGKGEREIAES